MTIHSDVKYLRRKLLVAGDTGLTPKQIGRVFYTGAFDIIINSGQATWDKGILKLTEWGRKTAESESKLPKITCKCGFQILVLPDVKAMDKAISAHMQRAHAQTENCEEDQERDLHIQLMAKARELQGEKTA